MTGCEQGIDNLPDMLADDLVVYFSDVNFFQNRNTVQLQQSLDGWKSYHGICIIWFIYLICCTKRSVTVKAKTSTKNNWCNRYMDITAC